MSLLRVHFARRQANVAGYVLSCHFRHADLATGETGKQKKSDQAPNTDVGQTMVASFARPLFRPRCR